MFQNIWAAKQLNERTMVSARRRRHFYEHWSAFMCFSADSGHLRLKDISIHIHCHSICILDLLWHCRTNADLLAHTTVTFCIHYTYKMPKYVEHWNVPFAIHHISRLFQQPNQLCVKTARKACLACILKMYPDTAGHPVVSFGRQMWQTMNGVLQNLAQSQSAVTCW